MYFNENKWAFDKKNKINKKIHIVSNEENTADKGDTKILCLKKFLNNLLLLKYEHW